MMRARTASLMAAACIGLAASGQAAAYDGPPVAGASQPPPQWQPSPAWQPPVRLSAGLLVGTGYGWRTTTGDLNADVTFSGGNWAQLGHVAPELALLFPPQRLFVSLSGRYQVVTGTTDAYAFGRVYHARTSAWALFAKGGWFPRRPEARVQPFISFEVGRGEIAHTASTSVLRTCGRNADELCVDTVTLGPNFVGPGTGLRWRLTPQVDAVATLDVQIAYRGWIVDRHGWFHDRGYNLDASVGMAVVF